MQLQNATRISTIQRASTKYFLRNHVLTFMQSLLLRLNAHSSNGTKASCRPTPYWSIIDEGRRRQHPECLFCIKHNSTHPDQHEANARHQSLLSVTKTSLQCSCVQKKSLQCSRVQKKKDCSVQYQNDHTGPIKKKKWSCRHSVCGITALPCSFVNQFPLGINFEQESTIKNLVSLLYNNITGQRSASLQNLWSVYTS